MSLAATVARRDGGQCAATLPGGETIIATAVGACVAGGRVDLVLRPEKVALGAAASGCTNRFPARVVEATFLGDQLRVRLAALGQEDFVREAAQRGGTGARSNPAPRSRSAGGRRTAVPSSRERRPRAQAAYWLILLPAVLMLVALYLVPLADVLVTSVTDPKPGLDNYALLFTSASVQKTLLTTLRIAAITTLFALLLGYIVAYAMRAATSRRSASCCSACCCRSGSRCWCAPSPG